MAIPFTDQLERHPPLWCRLVAVNYPQKKKYQWPIPRTDAEIAGVSGLTIAEVKFIGRSTDWNEIPVGKMLAFINGCRVTFNNSRSIHRSRELAGRGKFDYLRRSPYWEEQFKDLVALWESLNAGRPTK